MYSQTIGSGLGDKRHIIIAKSEAELKEILTKRITYSNDLVIQQFIDKDYEYDMMGCSYSNGHVYIPLSGRKVKFNHFLQDAGTVSYVEPFDKNIAVEVKKIKKLIKDIKYIGLFSVEFMHNKEDGKIYFTEVNFRNDCLNSFIVHEGVDLPFLHYQDLCGLPQKTYTPSAKSHKYICEGVHLNALIHKQISVFEWFGDLIGTDGFLYYYKEDPSPFYRQFTKKFSRMGKKLTRLIFK